ncbi:MAG: HYR domain-containing protein [Bacteroidales bacterium]
MRLKTYISKSVGSGVRLRVVAALSLVLFLQVVIVAQPVYKLGTDCGGGAINFYSEHVMNDRGTFRQTRILEDYTTIAGTRRWEFEDNFYWNTWRAPSNTAINIVGHDKVIPPDIATASAYWRDNYGGGNGARLLGTTNGYYYTFNIQEKPDYSSCYMSVLETSFNPKTMVLTDAPAPYGDRIATVTLSTAPSSGEYVYIRYTTDDYVNSTIIPVSFVGNVGTVMVPVPIVNGVIQKYYAYSSNRTKAQIDAEVVLYSSQVPHDMLTLELSNGVSNTFTNQVVVTSTGGVTLMNTYSTLKDAFAAINLGVNHTGTITISLIGNTDESVGGTAVLNAGNVAPSSYTSIEIRPAGGIARTISGNLPLPLVSFNGADNVTINGLNTEGNSLTISNTSVSAVAGTSTVKFNNDASNNNIINCSLFGSATIPLVTNGGTLFIGSTSGITGNDNITISNCKIGPAGSNLPSKGIFGSGNTTTATLANSNITISNCEIYDFFLAGGCAGIYVSNGNTDWNINNNKVYETSSRAMTSTLNGIYFVSPTYGNNIQIIGNTIGYSSNAGTGTLTLTGSGVADSFQGIYLSVGTATASSVQGNTIQSISISSTTTGSLFYGVKVNAGLVNIGTASGNVIGHPNLANSISISGSNSVASSVLIDASLSYTGSNIENNILANFTYTGTGTASLYGIKLNGNARKNKIYNIGSTTAGATPVIIGVYITGTSGGECSNNFIALSGGNATEPTVYGIYGNASTAATNNLYYNSINIFGSATTTSSTYAFRRGSNSPFVLKNNILTNNRTIGGSGTHLALYVSPVGSWTSDYNDLFTNFPNDLVYWGGSYYNFANWQAQNPPGQDSHSISVVPVFTSNTDLHLLTASNDGIDKKATILGTVTTDIDGAARDASTPDIGADEFLSTSCSPVTGGTASGSTSFCGSGTPTITASGYSVITGTTYQWQYSNNNFTSANDIAGQVNPAALTIGPVSATTWFRLRVTCPAAFDTGYSTVVLVSIKSVPAAITVTPASATLCNGNVQQLVASGGALAAAIFSENFNAGSNNWAKINNSTFGTPANAAWTLRPDGYSYSGAWHSNDKTQFFLSNSDAQGVGGVTATILESPAFSTMGYSAATLDFYHYFEHGFTDPARVDISSDGTSWTNLDTYSADQGAIGAFAHATYAVPAPFLNQPTVFIRFTYNANHQYYWGIDNVTVTGTPPSTSITWSPTTALYTDAGATIAYTGTNLATVYAKPAVTYTYTATSTSPESCTSSKTVTVTIPTPTATITAGGPTTFCSGGSVVLTASGGASYLWSNAAATQAITVTTSGSYTVTVTDINGCTAVSAPVTVTVNPPCSGAVTLFPDLTGKCPGDIFNVHVIVSGADVNSLDLLFTYNKAVLGFTAPGYANEDPRYTATIYNYNYPGYPNTSYIGILSNDPMQGYNLTNEKVIDLQFVYLGGNTAVHLNSSPDPTPPPWCTVVNSIAEYLTISYTDCSISAPLNVGIPTFTAGATIVCQDSPDETYTATAANSFGVTYSVLPIGAGVIDIITGVMNWNAAFFGTATITATATGCGGPTSANRIVTVNPLPTSLITPSGPTTICAGGSVVLSATPNAGYLWSTGAITQNITVTTAGTYTVTVTDGNGCTAISAPITVSVTPCATVVLQPDLAGLCVGDTFTVHVNVTGTDVFHLQLFLNFNSAVLTQTGYGSEYPGFVSTISQLGPGILSVDILGSGNTIFTGATIVDLYFTYIGGTTDIQFMSVSPFDSKVLNDNENLISTTFIGTGNITGSPINTVTLTSAVGTDNQTKCLNTAITNITYATTGATGATVTGLPTGVTGAWALNVVTISGTPTASGIFNYTVTLTGGCGNITATGTITVTANNTVTLTSALGTDNQTKCINTAITNITYATTGATGATVTGLPTGVTGAWASNVMTISGTPTASGTFNYTVTLTGGCGNITATGTITVTANNTVTLTSAVGTDNQTKCINTAITNITYATTGATGATVTGLPTGVTGAWASNVMTISGTPTASGTFNYTVTLTGGCGNITATGTITVTANNTVTLTSAVGTDNQTKCINTAITNITYATTGATSATVTGLPTGVSGAWASNVVTISGTPTASGTFNYTVTLTGGCGNVTAIGTITVMPNNTVTLTSALGTDNQTKCINTAITNITYATAGATGATVTGLPTGVTGIWASNVVTISGAPTASGTFNYSVTLTGGCGNVTATGTITVAPNNTVNLTSAVGTDNQTKCINTAITNITYATAGATGATVTGLPTGVTGAWALNVETISGTPTASGTFPYTVTLTGGCSLVTTTGTITVNPIPACSITGAVTLCPGAAGNVYTGPAGMTTYAWSISGNGTIPGATNGQTVTVTSGANCNSTFTLSLTVTDAGGCNSTCTDVVMVQDITNPVVSSCPANVVTLADLGLGYATLSLALPVFSDNCTPNGLLTISYVLAGATTGTGSGFVPAPTQFNIGTTTVTYTITDACGNSANCVFDVTVSPNYPPDITCLAAISQNAGPGLCTALIDPGFPPTLVSGTPPITYSWVMTGANTGSGTGAIGPFAFNVGITTITWRATNFAGYDECTQTITVIDNQPPTFFAPVPSSFCVNNIISAVYNPTPTPGITPEYDDITTPRPEYYQFTLGSTVLNLDPNGNNFNDNCCADNQLVIHWRIDFSPTPDPSTAAHLPITKPAISGQTGQPSLYGNIEFPGDGVNFTNINHFLYYWLVDCHGNASAEQMVTITIKPRPDVQKQ